MDIFMAIVVDKKEISMKLKFGAGYQISSSSTRHRLEKTATGVAHNFFQANEDWVGGFQWLVI